MKVNKVNLLEFLINSSRLEVPVFQRKYRWGEKQLKQLWEDIEGFIRNPGKMNHFFGIIVHIERDFNNLTEFKTHYLIDGQQRLLSISILLAVISDLYGSQNLRQNYLYNRIKGDHYPKIKLNKEDYDDYNIVLNEKRELFEKKENHIFKTYKFFFEEIKNSKLKEKDVLLALKRFELVDILLEKEIDNPQLIFDSLNSTGLELDRIEQIKNYFLMGLPSIQQTSVYYDYWKPMEEAFNMNNDTKLFERFLRDYLSIQDFNNSSYDFPDLYQTFYKFYNFKLKYQNSEEIIKHIYQYSKYFLMLFNNDFQEEAAEYIKRINALDSEKAYPFLMEVTEDYEKNLITSDIFCEILKTIELFILNHMRSQAEYTVQSFSELSKNISKMLISGGIATS
ncbi:MAG: DUF262 domain-containing protein [Candidatus Gastranaerophilaceae bacterium]